MVPVAHLRSRRGLESSRDIVLINPDEMTRLGLQEGQKIALTCAIEDGHERRIHGLRNLRRNLAGFARLVRAAAWSAG